MLNEENKHIAQDIWKLISESQKILLHCHPSPDGDSVGSTLAMYHALKALGKDVTAIWGDYEAAQQFYFLPGFNELIEKNYFEVHPELFDLFIIQDSGSLDRISMKGEITFPSTLRTINIDHHASNTKFADINFVLDTLPSTTAILYELFSYLEIPITPEIATCLTIGLFTDTGGFRHQGVTARTFEVMADLVNKVPNYTKLLADLENDIDYERVLIMGLSYSSIQRHVNGSIAMSVITQKMLKDNNIDMKFLQKQGIGNMLRSIKGVKIGIECIEIEPTKTKFSFRSRDSDIYDVSKFTSSLGGGGHRAAAGLLLDLPLEEAKKKVINALDEMFPDLNKS